VNLRRKVAILGAATALGAGTSVVAASPAFASSETVSGTVTCYYGNDTVDGVWVADNGTSGFAHLSGNGVGQQTYSYSPVNVGSTYTLHIGCGNSPADWGISFNTGPVSGTYYDWICSGSTGCYES
jgi:hypothetical protein